MKLRLSVLSFVGTLFLVAAMQTTFHTSVTRAQEKPSGTQASAKVVLTTEPSPARKGTNAVRVKLTDPEGKPISGAEVTVTFFMAAMPEMNMAAMKTVLRGTEKGAGVYEGKADLASGGVWQVTITARKNGEVIAMNKLTVKATSGM